MGLGRVDATTNVMNRCKHGRPHSLTHNFLSHTHSLTHIQRIHAQHAQHTQNTQHAHACARIYNRVHAHSHAVARVHVCTYMRTNERKFIHTKAFRCTRMYVTGQHTATHPPVYNFVGSFFFSSVLFVCWLFYLCVILSVCFCFFCSNFHSCVLSHFPHVVVFVSFIPSVFHSICRHVPGWAMV